MGLPAGRKTKTGYSTDAEVLETLAGEHKIAALILQYRELAKLKSTYADALPREVNPRTGRIHTNFSQTIAATGRLSSMNPNLQNIPVRTAMGREIRRTFVPDGPGCKLLSADYSQIELRILAHFSGDENLRRAYREGRDIHRLTASRVFGALEKDVTAEMRDKAKTINFGIIYGMGARGLALRLGIARADAQKFIDAYFGGYPGVRRWIDATLEGARRDGYVETMMGRRRRLAHINESNRVVRAADERIAVNTPIQGTSADMIKLAMIRVNQGLAEAAPKARMVLQVHDELIFSVPESQLAPAESFVTEAMREALPLDVPIVVDVAIAENWADCA
jgi:DNA polymerase-1